MRGLRRWGVAGRWWSVAEVAGKWWSVVGVVVDEDKVVGGRRERREFHICTGERERNEEVVRNEGERYDVVGVGGYFFSTVTCVNL